MGDLLLWVYVLFLYFDVLDCLYVGMATSSMYVCYVPGELRRSVGQDFHVRGPQSDRLLRGLQESRGLRTKGIQTLSYIHTYTCTYNAIDETYMKHK